MTQQEYEERKSAMERERDERTQKTLNAYNELLAKIYRTTFPALTGSERQIVWAEKIRATAQSRMKQVYKPGRTAQQITEKELAEMATMARDLTAKNAQWWIQNRARWGA